MQGSGAAASRVPNFRPGYGGRDSNFSLGDIVVFSGYHLEETGGASPFVSTCDGLPAIFKGYRQITANGVGVLLSCFSLPHQNALWGVPIEAFASMTRYRHLSRAEIGNHKVVRLCNMIERFKHLNGKEAVIVWLDTTDDTYVTATTCFEAGLTLTLPHQIEIIPSGQQIDCRLASFSSKDLLVRMSEERRYTRRRLYMQTHTNGRRKRFSTLKSVTPLIAELLEKFAVLGTSLQHLNLNLYFSTLSDVGLCIEPSDNATDLVIGSTVLIAGSSYVGFLGIGRVGVLMKFHQDGNGSFADVRMKGGGVVRAKLNWIMPLTNLPRSASRPVCGSLVSVQLTNPVRMKAYGVVVEADGSNVKVQLSGPLKGNDPTEFARITLSIDEVEELPLFINFLDVLDAYATFHRCRSIWTNEIMSLATRTQLVDCFSYYSGFEAEQSAIMRTSELVCIEDVLPGSDVFLVSRCDGSHIEYHYARRSELDLLDGPAAPNERVFMKCVRLVYIHAVIFGCYFVSYFDESGIRYDYVEDGDLSHFSQPLVRVEFYSNIEVETAKLERVIEQIECVVKGVEEDALSTFINRKIARLEMSARCWIVSYLDWVCDPVYDEMGREMEMAARHMKLHHEWMKAALKAETEYFKAEAEFSISFLCSRGIVIEIERVVSDMIPRMIDRSVRNTLFLTVSLYSQLHNAFEVGGEAHSIEEDLLIEQVFESLVERILDEQIAVIGFHDFACSILLADAAAGRNMDVISPFVREMVRKTLPAVAFQLISQAERSELTSGHVEQFGDSCSVCFSPYDCLNGEVATVLCCDGAAPVCGECLPSIRQFHRDRTPHPGPNGGLRLSGNFHVVQNLRRMRSAFPP